MNQMWQVHEQLIYRKVAPQAGRAAGVADLSKLVCQPNYCQQNVELVNKF
jgi:hypothetical protein